jgi:hypothetical protein
VDLTISLWNPSPVHGPYESLIGYFADAVYQESNTAVKLRKVTIYTGSTFASNANIVWMQNGTPSASPAGFGIAGEHINMFDVFGLNFLADDTGQRAGGYTLAHEFGHYYFGLWDEYAAAANSPPPQPTDPIIWPRTTDTSVVSSVMSAPTKAAPPLSDLSWLNFSTDLNCCVGQTAQQRVYAASDWATLVRPVSNDPRDGPRVALPKRVARPEVIPAAPAPNTSPPIDLPNAAARSNLVIQWADSQTAFQIVLDHSGSMTGAKLDNAKLAAKALVDLVELNHTTLGIIQFDDTVQVLQAPIAVNADTTRTNLKNIIDTIQPGNLTAIGDAANTALQGLNGLPSTINNRDVLLLTDGLSNSGVPPLSVIPAYQQAGVRMFTFGYGTDADTVTLQQMAAQTGGHFVFTPTTPDDVAKAFQAAFQTASSSVGLIDQQGSAPAGSVASFPFVVDSTLGRLAVAVTIQAPVGVVTLTLRDPTNTTQGSPVCSTTSAASSCVFEVFNPAVGQWQLQATSAAGTIPLRFGVIGSAAGGVPYYSTVTSLNGQAISYPQAAPIVARVQRGLPITGLGVVATVKGPDGTTITLPMRDDGGAPDAVANDGLYSAILGYTQNGVYDISVTFDNNSSNGKFTDIGLPDGTHQLTPVGENLVRSASTQITVSGVVADDHGNTPATATNLPLDNTPVAGRIDYSGDVDVFRLTNAAGLPVSVNVRVTDLALGMDPRLRILNADGSVRLTADLSTPGAVAPAGYLSVPVTIAAGGTVYAEVSQRGATVGGLYDISAGAAVGNEVRVLSLNGTSAFADASNAPDLDLTGSWTLETWFKDDSPQGFNHSLATLVNKGANLGSPQSVFFMAVGNNRLEAGRHMPPGNQSGSTPDIVPFDLAAARIDPMTWHHAAASYDSVTNSLILYLDGLPVSRASVLDLPSLGNSEPVEIGRTSQVLGAYWRGKLDDVRVWNVVRSAADIHASFRSEFKAPQPGLVANWQFDDLGTTASDSSGNHHDATLFGGATTILDIHPS